MSEKKEGFDPREFAQFDKQGVIAIILRNFEEGVRVYSVRHHEYGGHDKWEPRDVWGLLSETYLTDEEHVAMFPENTRDGEVVPQETTLAALSRCLFEELCLEDGPHRMLSWKLLGAFAHRFHRNSTSLAEYMDNPDTVGFVHVFLDEAPESMLPTGLIEPPEGVESEVAEAQYLDPRDLLSRPLRNTYRIPTILEDDEFVKILREHDIKY